jgi:hypothetical protein
MTATIAAKSTQPLAASHASCAITPPVLRVYPVNGSVDAMDTPGIRAAHVLSGGGPSV